MDTAALFYQLKSDKIDAMVDIYTHVSYYDAVVKSMSSERQAGVYRIDPCMSNELVTFISLRTGQ
jgi:hypothetical protein